MVNFDEPASDSDSDQEESPWRAEEPSTLECICLHVQNLTPTFKSLLQHVEFDQNQSWQLHEPSFLPDDYPAEEIKEYSFPDLLALMNWTDVDKIVLAMQLSLALSYYHGGGWLSGRWQQPNIRFFKWGPRIPCKPWLCVSLPSQSPIKPPKSVFHRFPQLLELGVILLELQIGQTLESSLGTKPAKNLDEKWLYANKVYSTKLNGGRLILSRHYRHAIQYCLKPDKAPKQPELLREAIYENVVLPLERAILESDLSDEAFESLDLGSIKRATLLSPAPVEAKAPAPRINQTASLLEMASNELKVPVSKLEEVFATAEIEEGFDLFGAEDGVEPDKGSVPASSFCSKLSFRL